MLNIVHKYMIIRVLYFARIKETVNYSTEEIILPEATTTIIALKQYLASRGEVWSNLFNGGTLVVRAAINHTLVDDLANIRDGDEVAFFPAVTGG